MSDVNKNTISGRLTRDPQLRSVGESKVVDFSVAVNEYYNRKENVTYIEVEAWDGLAERIEKYCKKGTLVFVDGRNRVNTWKSEDGRTNKKFFIRADNVVFNAKGGGGYVNNGASSTDMVGAVVGDDENNDDVPF